MGPFLQSVPFHSNGYSFKVKNVFFFKKHSVLKQRTSFPEFGTKRLGRIIKHKKNFNVKGIIAIVKSRTRWHGAAHNYWRRVFLRKIYQEFPLLISLAEIQIK